MEDKNLGAVNTTTGDHFPSDSGERPGLPQRVGDRTGQRLARPNRPSCAQTPGRPAGMLLFRS